MGKVPHEDPSRLVASFHKSLKERTFPRGAGRLCYDADMNLFECGESDEGRGAPMDGSVLTPLGIVQTSLSVHGHRLPADEPDEIRRLPSGARIACWDVPDGEVELLVADLHPTLPEGMQVDGCCAVLWRFTPHKKTGPVVFRARWLPGYRWSRGAPEPGEGLDAQTWSDGQCTVSVGTEAGDFLAFRAVRGQGLPQRIADDLLETGQALVTWDDESLIVPLPALERGELCQVHFIVAWSTEKAQGLSTWFAVDQDPRRILEEAGCS